MGFSNRQKGIGGALGIAGLFLVGALSLGGGIGNGLDTLSALLPQCSEGQLTRKVSGAWACADGGAVGSGDVTSDFQITGGDLDLSPAVTAPGTLASVGAVEFGSITSDHVVRGQVEIQGTAVFTTINYNGDATEDSYFRGGKVASRILFGDVNTGGVWLGSATNNTTVLGALTVSGAMHGIGAVDFDSTLNVDGTSALVGLVTATAGGTSPANWTTTGTGDLVSADDLTVGDDSNLGDDGTDIFDSNGDLSKFGTSAGDGGVFFTSNTIGYGYATDSATTGHINYYGYASAFTQFRSLQISDGKGAAIATFTGSTKAAVLAGALNVVGAADLDSTLNVDGAVTFNSTTNKGTITLAAGTGTATVLSGAVCACSDSTAVNAVKCAVSSTTLTATGTGTDAITYVCL